MTQITTTSTLAAQLYDQYETPSRDYFYLNIPYDITNILLKWLSYGDV